MADQSGCDVCRTDFLFRVRRNQEAFVQHATTLDEFPYENLHSSLPVEGHLQCVGNSHLAMEGLSDERSLFIIALNGLK